MYREATARPYIGRTENSDRFEQSKRVLITGLEVNNQLIRIDQVVNGQHILPYDITYLSNIRLNYKNRDFSLTFSNLSYSDERETYAYRLYPYQQEWIYTTLIGVTVPGFVSVYS